jgi:Mitochondrial carrier protein
MRKAGLPSNTIPSFDTVKVRLQTTQKSQFRGPLDCLLQTIRKEGVSGLYKGATPPLIGWMFMDSMSVFPTLFSVIENREGKATRMRS